MSLERIEIRNFQSLRKVDLDLGELTVIVGASSSGKSALMRAFRALASNVRGSGFITRGQKQAAITVRTKTHTVTLERSETAGTYRLADGSGTELTFTKLNGGVPEQITRALRIEPVPSGGSSVNFAAQFDRPYLLDESGANVARVLGELTNVSTIFEAVRNANKRRLAASSLLKTRQADLEVVRGRLLSFQGLTWRRKRLEVAEQLFIKARNLSERIERTERLLGTVQLAEQAQARFAKLPPVPDSTALDTVNNRYLDLVAKLRGVAAKTERWRKLDAEMMSGGHVVMDLENQLADLLREAGACPTCGQATV